MSADIHKPGVNQRRNQDEDSSESTDVARKSIFILKAKPHSLRSAENFLANRSWDLRPTTDVKMALMSLLKDPVDYVLIGVDHPNPSIAKVPDILSQTLKVPIILFTESLTPQSSMILRSSKYPYVLFPPVSGPSIERMLLKIEKEKQTAAGERSAEGSQSGQSAAFADQDMAKVFSGEGQSPMLGTNLGFGSGSSSTSERGHVGVDGKMSNRQSEGHKRDSGIAYDPRSQGFNPVTPDLSGLESSDSLSINLNPDKNSSNGYNPEYGAGRAQGYNPAHGSGGAQGNNPALGAGNAQGNNPAHGAGNAQGYNPALGAGGAQGYNPAHGAGGAQGYNPAPGLDPTFEALANLVPSNLLLTPDDPHYKRTVEHQSILSNCSKLALRAVAVPSPNLIINVPLLRNSNVACFEVESPNISGVVVVAFGSDRHADAKFAGDLRGEVLSYLKKHDIDFTVNDAMNLKIRQVEFEAWSAAEAQFLHKSVHAGDEIALSFFMNSDLKTPLEVSDDTRMLKLSIDDIRIDVPVDFDVYLHLPANQKYVRYIRRSGAISSLQWDRLTSRGVSEMHVQKAAAQLVKRYRVQNFINDTVDSYVERKKKAS